MPLRVLFYRDFRGLTGGHLKVHDYYEHVRASPNHIPIISFPKDTLWDKSNPWLNERGRVLDAWNHNSADILFIAGMDWNIIPEKIRESGPKPTINLIQGIRHSDPKLPLFQFLHYPAWRICVSEEVAQAILGTGRVNGPLTVIENGIDLSQMNRSRSWKERDIDVLILGLKNPGLAKNVQNLLHERFGTVLIDRFIDRSNLLSYFSRCKAAICIPYESEGFYLPALEAMASGCLVVCPDCIGNRGFCKPNNTALVPESGASEIARATELAFSLNQQQRDELISNAVNTAKSHDIFNERNCFHSVLQKLA